MKTLLLKRRRAARPGRAGGFRRRRSTLDLLQSRASL